MAVAYAHVSTLGGTSSRARWRWFARPLTVPTITVLALALLSVGLPLALAWLTGSISIPHNDAWSHAAIAQTYARTGSIQLVGWNRTGLLGQIVVMGPFGASIIAQHMFMAVLACVGLVTTYLFLQPRAGVAGALFGTAVVGFIPEYGLLATSYMSDMPAFAAVMTCLVLADRALRRGCMTYLALAVLVGVWGATVREQALVAPAAAVLGYAVAWRRRHAWQLLGLIVAAGLAFGLFELYRRGLPHGDPPQFDLSLHQGIATGVRALFTLCLYAAPAIALAARPRSWSVLAKAAAAVILVAAVLYAAARRGKVFLGNYLDSRGAYSDAAPGSRELFPEGFMFALSLVACIALSFLVGSLLSKTMHLDTMSMVLAVALVLGTAAQAVLGQGVFGRYLLPLLPVALAAILSVRRRMPPLTAGGVVALSSSLALLAVSVGLSLSLTANALAFDAARWKAAEAVASQGVPGNHIDAG